ncbi:unnamed protein product [Colias eurytheme]|nr:unnamed protein product [Colias eurytheme]
MAILGSSENARAEAHACVECEQDARMCACVVEPRSLFIAWYCCRRAPRTHVRFANSEFSGGCRFTLAFYGVFQQFIGANSCRALGKH